MPHLNLLGREALLGLTYRALAGSADPLQAQLSLRRIEQSAGEHTVTMQRRSQLRSTLEIARDHAKAAAREAQRLDLDLQLFNERYPPPPAKRGLLAARRTREQQLTDGQRAEMAAALTLARQDADKALATAEQLAKQLAVVEKAYTELGTERDQLNARFRGEVAAGVLSLVALGQGQQAREVLAEGRRMLRGDLLLATLWVLVALFEEGADAARSALVELKAVWEQHPDPVPHVLEGLLRVQRGDHLSRQALGIFPRGNFSVPGLWRLYLLTGMLAAWPQEKEPPETEGFAPTLWAVFLHQGQGPGNTWKLSESPASIAAWAARQDVVAKVIAANLLLRWTRWELIPTAAGYDRLADVAPLDYIPRPRKGQGWPQLLPRLTAQPLTAWPLPLGGAWAQALACHVLLAAQAFAPPELYDQWLAESHTWPSTPLKWWTQAQVLAKPGLLLNVREEETATGLFVLRESD